MNSLFVDTSGWASLFVVIQPHYLHSFTQVEKIIKLQIYKFKG